MVDALVGEQGIWWASVEGEREPPVLDAVRPDRVIFASPFLWRPRDVIELSIAPLGQGCQVHLRHTSDDPFAPLEAAALRHRWGEHIDRDLRDRFDHGGRPTQYEVSLYRGDVDDWTIIDRLLDRSWQAVERVPIEVRSVDPFRRPFPAGSALRPGDATRVTRACRSDLCLAAAEYRSGSSGAPHQAGRTGLVGVSPYWRRHSRRS